jgi:hypothetical protein
MKKLYTLSTLAVCLLMASCTRESNETTSISDESLIKVVKQSNNEEAGATVLRMKKQDFRIRMNDIARNSMAGQGEMAVTYASNSMLVKEYLDEQGRVTGYDVMYKAPADPNAHEGWLWASYDAEGNSTYSVNLKGNSCNSCHGKSSNLVLEF